jgi:predicted acyltransferase
VPPPARDADTLTRAEEQALARARRSVAAHAGKGGAGKAATRKHSAAKGAPRKRTAAKGAPARSATLDLLRGTGVVATVALLAGSAPATLPPWASPSPWHGITAADLVLPLFLVVAGAAIAWTDATRPADWRRTLRVLRRLLVLVALGVGLVWLTDPSLPRWTGLLQRLGLATALGWLVTRLPRSWQVAGLASVVVGWGLALERVAIPGVGRPVLRPDANLAAWFDDLVLGTEHLAATTDPLGVATLPAAAALVVAGRLLGAWLRARPTGPATTAALVVLGGWLGVLGIGWAQVTPMNAALWTPPFLLFAAGVVLALTGIAHLAAEVLPGERLLAPVQRLGRNALVAYLLPAATIAVASRPGADGLSAWARLVDRFAVPVFGDLATPVLAGALLAATWWVVGRLDDRGWHLRA